MDITVQSLLAEAIKSRYELTDSPTLGFADATIPKLFMEDKGEDESEISGILISPNLAQFFGGESLPFEQFCEQAGITKEWMVDTLTRIKERNIVLISVGYGGASINLLHFIAKFAELSGVHNIFRYLVLYEGDNLTVLNALRIYKPVASVTCQQGEQNKMVLVSQGPERLLSEHIIQNPEYLTKDHTYMEESADGELITKMTVESIAEKPGVVFFGAPDFEGRELLQGTNTSPFLFTGHSGSEIDIWRKPQIDGNLTVESYGKIDLSVFFVNLLHGARALCDILADGAYVGKSDELLFRYDATEEAK